VDRVEKLLQVIARLTPAERRRLHTELARGSGKGSRGGGRLTLTESAKAAVRLARALKRQKQSLRVIAADLEVAGHLNEHGRRYNPQSIRAMLEGSQKRDRPD
jgi:hypothetical protein